MKLSYSSSNLSKDINVQHVLAAKQFTPEIINKLFKTADQFRKELKTPKGCRELAHKHQGKVVATLFYEPSTRTRLSHESAAIKLGAGVISTENANESSSTTKGETLEDTIRTIQTYADAIVMRHKETGAAARAAIVGTVPIINAGDGKGEHPTQALLDLYTIYHETKRLENLTIVMGGDLAHGRTVRSLAQLLALYPKNQIIFVSTPELQIGQDIKDCLNQHNTKYSETTDMQNSLKKADVVYWTRLQKERLADISLSSSFVIDAKAMKALPGSAVIMHPLPRVDEITMEVDKDPRAAYFRQVENGLYIRMALFDYLFTNQDRGLRD